MKTVAVIRSWMDTVIMGFVIFLFALMVVLGSYQIITRYFFNSPSTFSEELLSSSFTWMAMLASACVFGKRDHMRIAWIADKLKGAPKKYLEIFIECLIFFFSAAAMIWGGWNIMMLSMQQKTASLGISMGVIYIIIPLTGIVLCIYCIFNIIEICYGNSLYPGNGVSVKGDDSK